jgi:acyl carrier protein
MSEVQTISNQIRDFILKKFPLARKRGVKESDLLLESGVLDSLGVLELVHFIEQEFKVQVSDEELVPENFQSIDRLVSFLQSKTGRIG